MSTRKAQIHAAVPTPLDEGLGVDVGRLHAHCAGLLEAGCDGIALFGTTGEGPSFAVDERIAVLDDLLGRGLDPTRLIVGTGCAALPDTIRLTRHAAAAGCGGQLVMPPFFFDQVTDDGVFAAYARVIERCAGVQPRIVPLPHPGGERRTAEPGGGTEAGRRLPLEAVFAIKDSSGDWEYTAGLIAAHGTLDVLVGHEPDISRAIAAGGGGTICGLANVVPDLLRQLCEAVPGQDTAGLQNAVTALASTFDSLPVIPALKAMTAAATGDPDWVRVRPPLTALRRGDIEALAAALRTARLG